MRQCLDLIRLAAPEATVWLSAPTWPTHQTILRYLGMPMAEYRYFDDESRGVDFEAMLADLDGSGRRRRGAAWLLPQPTGANLTLPQWGEVAALLEARQALPLVDLAYQGFGDGLDADAAGVRLLAARLPELLIAASCRRISGSIGNAPASPWRCAPNRRRRGSSRAGSAGSTGRPIPFRPITGAAGDHGARRPALRADWQAELEEVRRNMLALRARNWPKPCATSPIPTALPLSPSIAACSRGWAPARTGRPDARDHGIYMVGDSRVNIAGLNRATVPILAEAIVKAGV
ncbi:MAG: aminotransferase class I/II-fold pyridoxal phosphate-dependent enzyme [Rhodobacteraceae bacterium]|nr:aminotransferase class I/II-fold pyridoxal phosphate-dependent enzyme [Paracoccaceae bacterium]